MQTPRNTNAVIGMARLTVGGEAESVGSKALRPYGVAAAHSRDRAKARTALAERLPLLLLAALLRLGHRTIAGRLRLLLRHLEQRLLAAQRDLALAAHDAFALAGL